ncbi:hypothetical protein PILCRDRAFT_829393 [Piloderma croceum F 1598]|uniref:Uncharacterized protein n=1 Tax=Piloderma croceum (strain F 1598) TaxID=765440 RepID=A0A0C3B6Z1_PILCF|nr:hypothetical protein PILCRDRAFT_829393 [Piloderma croceum F 1598]
MDFDMVWQHYGQREFWDTCVLVTGIDDEMRIARAADPFTTTKSFRFTLVTRAPHE